MAVGNIVIRMPRRGSRWYVGEFAVAGGAITAGTTKFKGEVSVTRNSAGLYTFQCLENGVAAKPGVPCRLAAVCPTFTTPPGGATEGGWSWDLNADNLNTNGSWQLRINQQSWAVADPVQTVKVAFLIELEAA